jgi:hypothetical protein
MDNMNKNKINPIQKKASFEINETVKKQYSRKNFLIQSGILLTVPMFLENCASSLYPRLVGKSGNDPIQNAKDENYIDPILKAINVGITAPNPHNAQAWKFEILSSTEMNLYVDEKRILPITDPPARQIHIGQGTFLELLKIGSNQIGFDAKINLLPKGDYSFSEIGKKPVANIKMIPSKKMGHDLYAFVKDRATGRAEYFGDLISEIETKKISELGNSTHSELKFILGEEAMKPFKEIFFNAMKLESLTYRTNDESRSWFRFSDAEIQTKRDGIALPDQGVTGFTRWLAETFFFGPEPEKFHNKQGLNIFLERYKKKTESTKGIVYWKTKSNTKKDWILTGMDYARFQLAATKLDYKMHPFSQALQEFPEMDSNRKELDRLLGIQGYEKIQMIARLGRSDYKYFTPRRSLKDMMI